MSHKDYTKIYANGRIVGNVRNGVFYKSVHASKHFLRRPPSIANDISVLDQAEQAGAVDVCITDQESGTQYTSTLAHIRRAGFIIDRGYGVQICLPLSGFGITRKGQIPVKQLSLWSGV